MTKYIAVIGTSREYDHWVHDMRYENPSAIYRSSTRKLTIGYNNYYFISSYNRGSHGMDNIRGMILDDVIYLGSAETGLDLYTYQIIQSRLKRNRV